MSARPARARVDPSAAPICGRRLRRALLALLVVVTACARGTQSPYPLQSAGCPRSACVRIVSPRPGAVLAGGVVRIHVRVAHFPLAGKQGGAIVYYRLESAGARIPTDPGRPATSGGVGSFTSYLSRRTTHAWHVTPYAGPGTYVYAVQLVHANGTPLQPPATAGVAVTVRR